MSHTLTSPRAIDISTDGHTMTIRVPLTLRRIGGRKRVISPPGATAWMPPRPQINSPLLHALVRAFHWQSLLETGDYGSVNELARAHGKNASYVAAILRLTLLAPDIVEAVLDGLQPAMIQLQPLMREGIPAAWEEQRRDSKNQSRAMEQRSLGPHRQSLELDETRSQSLLAWVVALPISPDNEVADA